MASAPTLKLAAFDADDLAVISAHLQDAVLLVGDIHWLKSAGKLAFVASRYDHLGDDRSTPAGERRQCGVQFLRVNRVAARNIRMDDKAAVLSLLAITFTQDGDGPEGTIELAFSGDGSIRLEVECIEAAMADLGPSWPARARPHHAEADKEGGNT